MKNWIVNREGNHFLLNAFKSIGVKASFFFFTRMAAMLSKFRIDFSDVIVITDITKKSSESTRNYFNGLIKNFVKNEDGQGKLSFFFCIFEEENSEWEKRMKQKEREKSQVEDRLDKVGI